MTFLLGVEKQWSPSFCMDRRVLKLEGVLLLRKPEGMTSHDCVNKIRRLFNTRKVGHTGTLDPLVSGVLPICIGKATKIAQYLTADNKTYVAEITLGEATTTEDQSGEVVDRKTVSSSLTVEEVLYALKQLTGTIKQTPPMYSAIKVNGRKLYEYARLGIEIERPTRMVTIHQLNLRSDIQWKDGKASFHIEVECSKGTYIRTLAVMIGEKLGYPAHMSHLIRTKSGSFSIDRCMTFSEIEEAIEAKQVPTALLSINEALKHLPYWAINGTLAEKVGNGAVLSLPAELNDVKDEFIRIIYKGECIALYTKHPTKEGLMKPVKVFY